MQVEIIPASQDDLTVLSALEQACFPTDGWSEDSVLTQLSSSFGISLVARGEEGVLGYLFASYIPPEGELLRIAVVPKFRGSGVGKQLLLALLSRLSVCFLEVREGNTAARALYEGVGFVLTGKRAAYYRAPREDACLYRFDRQKGELDP